MKSFKKLSAFLLALVMVVNLSVLGTQVSAHEAVLDVGYDICVPNRAMDGVDELWYVLNKNSHCYHISEDTDTIKYYFANSVEGSTYTWTTDVSEDVAQEIKNAYVESMKKWNNVYFYSYNAYGTLIKNKVINIVEGTESDHNLTIYPVTGEGRFAATGSIESSKTIIENGTVEHAHISKWVMWLNIDWSYVNGDHDEDFVRIGREETGAHEIGHVLGLKDVDRLCNSGEEREHHRELLMEYGEPLCLRATNITYKDIAGVAITRGFHTDSDHKWLNCGLQSDGNYKLVCSICNGVKQVTSLSGYTYETYGACNNRHTVSYGNMMAVASYGTKDYYKCKYCRYVARFESNVEQNYTKTFHTDYLHKCVNTVNGLEYTFYEEHTVVNHECTGCGEHIHSYSKRYVWQTEGRHKCYCECGEFITASHVVLKDSFSTPDGYGICIQCRGRVFMGVLLSNGVDELPHTENGSYLLPNGTVVLAEADLDAYLKGELIFYSGETE